MAETTITVGRVAAMVPSDEDPGGTLDPNTFDQLVVTLESGRVVTARGARARTWRSTLRQLVKLARPASFEIDTVTGDAVALRLPVATRVRTVNDVGANRSVVSLLREQVEYELRRSDERERRVLEILQHARATDRDVLVTVNRSRGTIVDAIVSDGPSEPLALLTVPSAEDVLSCLEPVTLADLNPIFEELNRRNCPHLPVAPDDACLPLRYPDRFCNTIASVVCHMLEARGIAAAKLWLKGEMVLQTANHPCCKVEWDTHVAALVRLKVASGKTELAVIDPGVSLTDPIARANWQALLARTPRCRPIPIPSPPETYWLESETNYLEERPDDVPEDLESMRLEYGKRIAGRCGAPPYECD